MLSIANTVKPLSAAQLQRAGLIALSAACAAGTAGCAIEFLRWRRLETLLSASFCGDTFASAMAIGQCSHCFAVAGTALTLAALAPWVRVAR